MVQRCSHEAPTQLPRYSACIPRTVSALNSNSFLLPLHRWTLLHPPRLVEQAWRVDDATGSPVHCVQVRATNFEKSSVAVLPVVVWWFIHHYDGLHYVWWPAEQLRSRSTNHRTVYTYTIWYLYCVGDVHHQHTIGTSAAEAEAVRCGAEEAVAYWRLANSHHSVT